MIKKKEINLINVVKGALNKANKDLGYLNEAGQNKSNQDERFVYEPFDPEKHMARVELKPQQWATPTTPEAQDINVLLENIIVPGASATETYKNTINNLNSILGMKTNEAGAVIAQEEQADMNDVTQVLKALQVKMILYSIIFNQSSQVAGKMLEGFMARIVGGEGTSDIANPIQDIETSGGEYISLKVLHEGSEFKGSKYNLAVGINNAGAVTYLVVIKSTKRNPFSITAKSFKISKDNYFAFISNRLVKELNIKLIHDNAISVVKKEEYYRNLLPDLKSINNDALGIQDKMSKGISPDDIVNDILSYKTFNAKPQEKPQKKTVNIKDVKSDDFQQAVIKYAKDFNVNLNPRESIQENLKQLIENLLSTLDNPMAGETADDLKYNKRYIVNNLPELDVNSEKFIENTLVDNLLAKKIIMPEALKQLEEKINTLNKKDTISLIAEYEKDNPEIVNLLGRYKDYLSKVSKPTQEKLPSFTAKETKFLESIEEGGKLYNDFRRRIRFLTAKIIGFTTMYSKISDYARKIYAEKNPDATDVTKPQQLEDFDIIKTFSDAFFKTVGTSLTEFKETEGKTQFKYDIGSAFSIARSTNAEMDEDYPHFYIEKGWIMMSSQKNTIALKKILSPFYEGIHITDSGLKQTFIYDEPAGLKRVSDGISATRKALESYVGTFGDTTPASKLPQQKIKDLQENKNKTLTSDWSSDILDWVKKLN